jgi:hypothetical protein
VAQIEDVIPFGAEEKISGSATAVSSNIL